MHPRRIWSLGAAVAVAALIASASRPTYGATIWQPGDVITHTQDVWGTPGTGAGVLLANEFDAVYFTVGGVLRVGSILTMTFTSPSAIYTYMPAVGVPGQLDADVSDPYSTVSGQLGGEVVALKLNVDFSDAGHTIGTLGIPFGDLVIHDYDALPAVNGSTVRQFLSETNVSLGGGAVGYSVSDAFTLAVQLNASFGGGLISSFAQDHLQLVPEPSTGLLVSVGLIGLATWRQRRA